MISSHNDLLVRVSQEGGDCYIYTLKEVEPSRHLTGNSPFHHFVLLRTGFFTLRLESNLNIPLIAKLSIDGITARSNFRLLPKGTHTIRDTKAHLGERSTLLQFTPTDIHNERMPNIESSSSSASKSSVESSSPPSVSSEAVEALNRYCGLFEIAFFEVADTSKGKWEVVDKERPLSVFLLRYGSLRQFQQAFPDVWRATAGVLKSTSASAGRSTTPTPTLNGSRRVSSTRSASGGKVRTASPLIRQGKGVAVANGGSRSGDARPHFGVGANVPEDVGAASSVRTSLRIPSRQQSPEHGDSHSTNRKPLESPPFHSSDHLADSANNVRRHQAATSAAPAALSVHGGASIPYTQHIAIVTHMAQRIDYLEGLVRQLLVQKEHLQQAPIPMQSSNQVSSEEQEKQTTNHTHHLQQSLYSQSKTTHSRSTQPTQGTNPSGQKIQTSEGTVTVLDDPILAAARAIIAEEHSRRPPATAPASQQPRRRSLYENEENVSVAEGNSNNPYFDVVGWVPPPQRLPEPTQRSKK